jgi:uncharacterized coiled-coil protein SlyX
VSTEETSARLERAEAALAHLEKNYDELNAVIIAQGKTITRLQKRLEDLGETIRSQETDRIQPHNQKPPHYSP